MTMFESIPFSDGRDDVDNMSFVWKLSAVVIAHIVRFVPQKLNQYPYQRWKQNSCENKNYYVVRNVGCTHSRYTLKSSFIFLINESTNE